MIETHLSIFDAVVVGIMLASCLFAFFRGFVREILSLGAWIGAAVVTLYYFPTATEKLQPYFKTPVVAAGFATLGLYIGALVGFSILNLILLKFIKSGDEVGALDNIFGLLFGAARGAFIIALGFFLLAVALPEKEYPDWLKSSVTLPYVEKITALGVSIAPGYVQEIAALQKKLAKQAAAPEKNVWTREPTIDEEENAAGYSKDSRTQLDRLLDSMKSDDADDK